MNAGPRLGTLLLLGTTALSGLAAWGGQRLLVHGHQPLTPDQSAAQLWTTYRWAIDPQQRREAALLMAAQTGSFDGLQSQAWGTNPLGAVALVAAGLLLCFLLSSAALPQLDPLVMERPRARNLHIACIDTVHIICSDTGQHRRGACPRCSGQNFCDDTHRISAAISATIDEAQAQDVQAITHAMRYIASSAAMPLTIDKSTRRKPRP